MEICKIKISKELLTLLVDSEVITTKDFEVIGVDENSFDYSSNPVWVALKEESNKIYKKLKIAEFKIRNGE